METNKIIYLLILLFYSCDINERYNDGAVTIIDLDTIGVVTDKGIINLDQKITYDINDKDTVFIEVQIPISLQEKYVDALKKYIGTRELTGNNDGKIVTEILRNCGIEYPAAWCACYLNQGLLDIGLQGPPNAAWSPVWFTDKRRILWKRSSDSYKFDFPKGSVFGIYYRSLNRIGHVGVIVEDFHDGYILTIEGNTNSQGGREGNGVYLRIRHKSEIYILADWVTQY